MLLRGFKAAKVVCAQTLPRSVRSLFCNSIIISYTRLAILVVDVGSSVEVKIMLSHPPMGSVLLFKPKVFTGALGTP